MASETLRASGALSLGGTGRVGGGTTTFSALGDDMPNLPQFRKNKQVARPRLHNFSGANGTVYEKHWKPAEVDHLGGLVHRAEAIRGISTKEKEAIAQRKAAAAAARAGSMDYQSNLTEIPVDVQTEKQVLRAYAYYQEAVPESREETFRVRRVNIHCHLEDQTIAVIEPKEDNAGMPQGTVLSRQRIPKRRFDPALDLPAELRDTKAAVASTASAAGVGAGTFGRVGRGGRVAGKAPTSTTVRTGMLGSAFAASAPDEWVHYDWQDLLIGNEVSFYGRVFRIYDVDGFTRRWFGQAGLDQGPPEGIPGDPHHARLEELTQRAGPKSQHGHNKRMYGVKEHMEAMRGKFVRDPRKRAQFQDHDGEVLRFDTIWDERTPGGEGDISHFCLNYFLADDEVEVREMHKVNNGKDPFPALLKKCPLPKDWRVALQAGSDAARHAPELFVRPADLRIGGTVNVYGRTLQIRAVDPFTREYYARRGMPQPPASWESAAVHTPAEHVVPPHTGFGTEEDSKLSVRYVRPLRGPRQNYNKWMVHDGQVFRWRAALVSSVAQDSVRRFTISYYPADDSLAIYEPPARNGGFVGGKFLRRDKHKTPGGVAYDPASFVPGSTVRIGGHGFAILDADPFTRTTLPSTDVEAPEEFFALHKKSMPPAEVRRQEAEALAQMEAAAAAAEDEFRARRAAARAKAASEQKAREDTLLAAAATEVSKGSVPGMAVPAGVKIPSMYATTAGAYGAPAY